MPSYNVADWVSIWYLQITAFRDFTTCKEFAATVKASGGSAKLAAGCSGNFRRVKLVSI
jgi:hypothetical protein